MLKLLKMFCFFKYTVYYLDFLCFCCLRFHSNKFYKHNHLEQKKEKENPGKRDSIFIKCWYKTVAVISLLGSLQSHPRCF